MRKTLPEHHVVTAEQLRVCCEDIARHSPIGFDTEFVGEETYVPQLCLIQIATPQALYVIDPFECGPLDDFWALLTDPRRIVIVHAGREEVRICRQATGKPLGQMYDLQIVAGLLGYGYPMGYAALAQSVLRIKIAKGETLTDWRRRPLTREQIAYAYNDVRDLLALWKKMDAKLNKLGRTGWAAEEFKDFVENAVREPIEMERWRKIKGAGGLNSRELAVLRAVYAWRDETANRRNRPARTVLRDDLLLELAKRTPRDPQDVMALRGVQRVEAENIFDAITEALASSPHTWPAEAERENDSQAVQLVTDLLNVVLADWCGREDLTRSLVATVSDMRELVRSYSKGEPMPPTCGFAHGWRKSIVLPMLREVLEGRRALRVKTLEGNTPFEFGHVRSIPRTKED
ncbi:ribonuclease D [Zavarzinella formosa]|uniref:ribonuclease D n=1 Tax=Zavarzinella formosa TaxID=360055 RepID=UPI0003605C2C|nr:ribonuclease D [Zavarzinella formosa]